MDFKFYDSHSECTFTEFGCASVGFAGSHDKDTEKCFHNAPNGLLICGTYDECLKQIPEQKFNVGIVLTGNYGNENEFVDKLRCKLNIPLVGGGAAINEETGEKALLTGQNQAAIYLISDDSYEYEVLCENIHHDVLGTHTLSFTEPRTLNTIDNVDAKLWLKNKKAEMGISPDDFEHLTFSDMNGFNVHLSITDGVVHSGADLKSEMQLRYVPEDKVNERIQKFYNDADSIVFGCAGLKGILSDKVKTSGLGLFLYGEICTHNQQSRFSNLMLSKLRIKQLCISAKHL